MNVSDDSPNYEEHDVQSHMFRPTITDTQDEYCGNALKMSSANQFCVEVESVYDTLCKHNLCHMKRLAVQPRLCEVTDAPGGVSSRLRVTRA